MGILHGNNMRDYKIDLKNNIKTVANFMPRFLGEIYFIGLIVIPFILEIKYKRDLAFFVLPGFAAIQNLKERILRKDWKMADEDTAKCHVLFGVGMIVRLKFGEWGWF
ncbi:hypothetical protein TrLO_g2618 [Triparma laevis f. longispina]|uniref:Uncharacterized protein n=1 Tax=Triparma laevis f. longispina TaxID=1714387 RepID=A0A9W7KXH3_9STRA|nr:hypothetical protein TrLO_g2618 [Triparma laevis f. longispina]